MLCVHRGFDGLDVSFGARIDNSLCAALENARLSAQAIRRPSNLDWRGVILEVGESGARGGYAFRCAIGGEFGITWFFKRPSPGDPWGVRASCRSFGLATRGLGGMRAELYATMDRLGILPSGHGESLGRVDYAVDVLAPGLVLEPDNFVMHSNSSRADHVESFGINGRSGRVTSVTIGKMPGRQVIIYDKRAEVIAKCKPGWWSIWNAALGASERPVLDPTDAHASAVFRIELRAGKKHLKEDWGIRRWSDLEEQLAPLLEAMLNAIRYTFPCSDSNRSRWPESDIWKLVRLQVADDLFELRSPTSPDLVKRIQLEAHDKLLAAQMAGLLATRAALRNIPFGEVPSYAERVGAEIGEQIARTPKQFAEKMRAASARYDVTG